MTVLWKIWRQIEYQNDSSYSLVELDLQFNYITHFLEMNLSLIEKQEWVILKGLILK